MDAEAEAALDPVEPPLAAEVAAAAESTGAAGFGALADEEAAGEVPAAEPTLADTKVCHVHFMRSAQSWPCIAPHTATQLAARACVSMQA